MRFLKHIVIFFLTLEARMILARYKPFVIAVTGSVGKTSTKDAVYSVVRRQWRYVRKSEKSLNSEIGLPLTVIGVPNAWHSIAGWIRNMAEGVRLIVMRREYPDCLILEVGADHPGDIHKVVRWLRPDIAIITRVSEVPVHVEFFNSPEEVFREKAALARGVKRGGTVILYTDSERVIRLGDELRTHGVNVKDIKVEGADLGFPLRAAREVGLLRGMSEAEIDERLKDYAIPKGRMNLIPGIHDTTIIDDSYNSSPDAVRAAFARLKDHPTSGRRVVVLGDMMELGSYSAREHRAIGRDVVGVADIVVTVGPRSRATADEAISHGFPRENVFIFDTAFDARDRVVSLVHAGDTILVKGSQSMRTEHIVKALLKEPQKAATLLVRQEEEWLKK